MQSIKEETTALKAKGKNVTFFMQDELDECSINPEMWKKFTEYLSAGIQLFEKGDTHFPPLEWIVGGDIENENYEWKTLKNHERHNDRLY